MHPAGGFSQLGARGIRDFHGAPQELVAIAADCNGTRRLPLSTPTIEQRPSYVPESFIKYEDMPRGAEQRALAMRAAWISRHFGDESQAFPKMMVTAAQINSLLRIVEADRSLVHSAYYTDDECIARIADWISGKR